MPRTRVDVVSFVNEDLLENPVLFPGRIPECGRFMGLAVVLSATEMNTWFRKRCVSHWWLCKEGLAPLPLCDVRRSAHQEESWVLEFRKENQLEGRHFPVRQAFWQLSKEEGCPVTGSQGDPLGWRACPRSRYCAVTAAKALDSGRQVGQIES